ncbi:MAG: hypothetical protein ACOYKE_08535 [Ferruginibacter sp.]
MKKILLAFIILFGYNLKAQQCIPNPEKLSRDLFENIRDRYVSGLDKLFIQWSELEPLFDSTIAYRKKNKVEEGFPDKDSIKADFIANAQAEFRSNIDSIINRGERIGMQWKQAVFIEDKSNIKTEATMPAGFWVCDSKIKFAIGDSIYRIAYSSLLVNNNWKVANVLLNIEVFDKEGKGLGLMNENYIDYKQELTVPDADTNVAPALEPAPIKEAPAEPATTKPVKKSTPKSAAKKDN